MKVISRERTGAPAMNRVHRTVLAVAGVLALGGGDAAPKPDDPEAAATVLAAPFAACAVAKVVDSRVQPPRITTSYPRTTVTVTLDAPLKPGASEAQRRYWEDDTVQWQHPSGAGVIYDIAAKPDARELVAQGFKSQFSRIEKPAFDLYPRKWPLGTRMGVYALFQTRNVDIPGSEWKQGGSYCGDLQVTTASDGGTEWQVAPNSPQVPPAPIKDLLPRPLG